jgi:hypothetical protein
MLTVRPARREDGPAFIGLVRALSAFEKLPGPDDAAAGRLLRDAFGDPPRFELHVAELEGEIVAYAVTFLTYSTFLARPSYFLEDLFVHPRAMMERLRARARELDCGRFEWMVLDWNTGAQTFYESLGAERLDTWRLYRVNP